MSNSFDSFSNLPKDLQIEAIREGEARLNAQLVVANAADSRALTWGGLLVAAVTGSLGAGIALIDKEQPDFLLALIALSLAAAFLRASERALSTVVPKEFHFPGNTPEHWLPSAWAAKGTAEEQTTQARKEQAQGLANSISANALKAKENASSMQSSFSLVRYAIGSASLAVFGVVVFRIPSILGPSPYVGG